MRENAWTPLFNSLTTGTLCGRWPDIGFWAVLLSLADAHGNINYTTEYIARVTGLPESDVIVLMQRFCSPDPLSRSKAQGGARLVLLDPFGSWGWHVVNRAKYKEKARKSEYDASRTTSGADARRKRSARGTSVEQSRDVPRCPAMSRELPLLGELELRDEIKIREEVREESDSDARARYRELGMLDVRMNYPRRAGNQPWRKAIGCINARLKQGYTWQELVDGVRRYAAYCDATDRTGTEYVMYAATFFGRDLHFLEAWVLPESKSKVRQAKNISAAEQWLRGSNASK